MVVMVVVVTEVVMVMVMVLSCAAHLMHMRTTRPAPRRPRHGRPTDTDERPAIRARALYGHWNRHRHTSRRSGISTSTAACPSLGTMGMGATARARYAMLLVVLGWRKVKWWWAFLPERRSRGRSRGHHGLFRDVAATGAAVRLRRRGRRLREKGGGG